MLKLASAQEMLRKCVRSEETCPEGASEAYFCTEEKPLGQRFAGDGVFYPHFPKCSRLRFSKNVIEYPLVRKKHKAAAPFPSVWA